MHEDDIWADMDRSRSRRPPRPRRERTRDHIETEPDHPPGGSTNQPAGGRRLAFVAILFLLVGAVIGAATISIVSPDSSEAEPDAENTSTATVATEPDVDPPVETTITEPSPATTRPPAPQGSVADDLAKAEKLAPATVLPSDCGLPVGHPQSFPNDARSYRGGIHQGIDFICGERGRDAVTALDGQVLIADRSYEDPTNEEREEILATGKALGYTPPWTLAMLFGRVVVIDHGIQPDIGHVVTIYAHLEEIDPAIRPGLRVKAGDRLGEIGNRGTETAATGGTRPQSIHLHWEIHIDDHFLGEGADAAETETIYRTLFGR